MDEALTLAFSAAELAVKAVNQAKDAARKTSATNLFELLLKDIEHLKLQKSQQPDDAFSDLKPLVTKVSKIRKLKEPVSSRPLPNSEKILLLKASFINGFKFPPWKEAPTESEFELQEGEQLFQYVLGRVSFEPVC